MSSDSKYSFQNRRLKCTSVWLKNSAGTAKNRKKGDFKFTPGNYCFMQLTNSSL